MQNYGIHKLMDLLVNNTENKKIPHERGIFFIYDSYEEGI